MEIYVYDQNMTPLGVIETYSSLQWTRRYYKSGDFELQCPVTSETIALLTRKNIIWPQGDPEAGFIKYRDLKLDDEGKEIIIVKGNFLTRYLDRRILWGTEYLTGSAEAAMQTLVTRHAISPANSIRKIPLLILSASKDLTPTVNYQTSYAQLSDELENLSSLSGLGHRILFDPENIRLLFDVYAGLDRSAGQTTNSPAIFAQEFDNILEQELTDSDDNYRSVALVGGQGDGSARKLVTTGGGSGLDRYEIFVDAKNVSNQVSDGSGGTITLTDAQYTALLTDKGNTELAKHPIVTTFDNKVNLHSNLIYKTDYNLGDIVTCLSKKWGVTLDTRITEIQEIYEESGMSVNITFGNNVPTLIDKIKQRMR